MTTANRQPLVLTGRHEGERIEAPDGMVIQDAHLIGCEFRGNRIPRYVATGSLLERCDFRGLMLVANLSAKPRTTYRDCDFSEADLRRAAPGLGRFERCSFGHARIDRWFATQAEFVDCRFAGLITSARFAGSSWPAATAAKVGARALEFVGNDFREAELTDVSFVGGIDIGSQRWPASEAYALIENLPAGLAAAEAGVAAWPDDEDRRLGLEMLGWMLDVYAGQRGQVRRRGQSHERVERVWELIESGSELASASRAGRNRRDQ